MIQNISERLPLASLASQPQRAAFDRNRSRGIVSGPSPRSHGVRPERQKQRHNIHMPLIDRGVESQNRRKPAILGIHVLKRGGLVVQKNTQQALAQPSPARHRRLLQRPLVPLIRHHEQFGRFFRHQNGQVVIALINGPRQRRLAFFVFREQLLGPQQSAQQALGVLFGQRRDIGIHLRQHWFCFHVPASLSIERDCAPICFHRSCCFSFFLSFFLSLPLNSTARAPFSPLVSQRFCAAWRRHVTDALFLVSWLLGLPRLGWLHRLSLWLFCWFFRSPPEFRTLRGPRRIALCSRAIFLTKSSFDIERPPPPLLAHSWRAFLFRSIRAPKAPRNPRPSFSARRPAT